MQPASYAASRTAALTVWVTGSEADTQGFGFWVEGLGFKGVGFRAQGFGGYIGP